MIRKMPLLACVLATTILAACQAPHSANADTASLLPSSMHWSAAGSYLAGRFARSQGDWENAAKILPAARKANPQNGELALADMLAEIHGGHFPEATHIAESLYKNGLKTPTIVLILAGDAVLKNDYVLANRLVNELPSKGDNQYIVPLLKAWVAYGNGKPKDAFATLNDAGKLQGFGSVAHLHLALMQDIAKADTKTVDGNFKAALEAEDNLQPRWLELYTGFLSRSGNSQAAHALLGAITNQLEGDLESSLAKQLLARLDGKAGIAPEITDARSGLAQAFFELSWLFAKQRLVADAAFFGQLSLALEPKSDAALLLMGDIARTSQKWDRALGYYQKIPQGSLYRENSQLSLADTMRQQGKFEEAVKLLQKLTTEDPHFTDAPSLLGDMLRSEKKYKESVDAYTVALERKSKADDPRNWSLYYYRGTSHERNNQWDLAEKDFLHALQLAPDQPYVLNYLAYSWTERKQNMDKAVQMLERAVQLRPEEGFIIDSLGWVYFQLGNVDKAVPLLERAVQLAPGDPTLNDHLGDAYWQSGRRTEARFQWQRALLSNPEPEQVSPIEAKLKNGLVISKNGG